MMGRMKVIVIANTKGGVGKTTTAVYLAMAAYNADPDGSVFLLDCDPQKSATAWANIASGAGDPLPYRVTDGAVRALHALQGCDVVIVDTPTGDGRMLRELAREADMVVVPTEPDGLGLARTYATLDVCGDKGVVLLTRVRRRTRLYAEAKGALADDGAAIFDTEITDSVRYRTYGTRPQTAGEYADVWREIREELG